LRRARRKTRRANRHATRDTRSDQAARHAGLLGGQANAARQVGLVPRAARARWILWPLRLAAGGTGAMDFVAVTFSRGRHGRDD